MNWAYFQLGTCLCRSLETHFRPILEMSQGYFQGWWTGLFCSCAVLWGKHQPASLQQSWPLALVLPLGPLVVTDNCLLSLWLQFPIFKIGVMVFISFLKCFEMHPISQQKFLSVVVYILLFQSCRKLSVNPCNQWGSLQSFRIDSWESVAIAQTCPYSRVATAACTDSPS